MPSASNLNASTNKGARPAQVEPRSGHLEIIGETAAKLLLFQQGWNPYSRFLDVDKVDLILRRTRHNLPEYRELQVKYRRLFPDCSGWASNFFSATAWFNADGNEFAAHRPGFFILFVFGHPDRQIEKDVLIFPSGEFHQLLQRAGFQGKSRVIYFSKSCTDSRWFVRLARNKFSDLNAGTVVDVTSHVNNFALLD